MKYTIIGKNSISYMYPLDSMDEIKVPKSGGAQMAGTPSSNVPGLKEHLDKNVQI